MNIEVINFPSEEDVNEIRMQLHQYNQSMTNTKAPYNVGVFAYGEGNKKIAGLIGIIWGNWMLIQLLWVDTPYRDSGLGTQLLKQAEEQAIQNGCKFSFVETFSFQAKPFYEKHGYQVNFVLDNCPINEKRYSMTKCLN